MLIRCNHGCHCLYGNPADSHAIKSGSLPKSVGIRAIDVQTGVKHGNPADNQVEKSGHPPAILGVRMPGCPLILYTGQNPSCRGVASLTEPVWWCRATFSS